MSFSSCSRKLRSHQAGLGCIELEPPSSVSLTVFSFSMQSSNFKTMIYPLISTENPLIFVTPNLHKPSPRPSASLFYSNSNSKSILFCCQHKNLNNTIDNFFTKPKTHFIEPIIIPPPPPPPPPPKANHGHQVIPMKKNKKNIEEESKEVSQVGVKQMLALCGFGYWVQGFRCFPWLALNFHMAHNLHLHPSTLQLVQTFGNLPMVAKPLYGVLSDALFIGGAHRIPYISIGVLLQILSWGPLALIPVAGGTLPTLMACVLLSNLGAAITEVAKDALVAEYDQKHKMGGLQSYAFMALAAGGILGNLLGGFLLMKTQPQNMFFVFSLLLASQLAMSLRTREDSLGLPQAMDQILDRKSFSESIRKQFSDLIVAVRDDNIFRPLTWIVASIATIPILSGSMFCYQTQCLNLDPSIIGMSRVVGQLMLLSMTVLYDRFWKRISMRKLIGTLQIVYASSLLLDLVLVKQINLNIGIPNEVFALCFSGLAETVAQFKILPFSVLFASLCPPGCEGSLTSFLASALCLSSIVSGLWGVGVASLLGITSSDYSSLPLGILIQFFAALVPLVWMNHVPMSQPLADKERNRGRSKRSRRNRRVGRVIFGFVYAYRRQRET